MTFPRSRLDLHVELHDGSDWLPITRDVLLRDGITITRGRSAEGARADPTSISLSLISSASRITGVVGRYNPDNPASDLYGRIGLGTPLRVSVGSLPVGASTAGEDGVAATNQVAPSVTAPAGGLLVCVWQAYGDGDYTPPVGMTGDVELTGDYSTSLSAVLAVGAGATGTRTAVLDTPWEWSAVAGWLPGTITVEEQLSDAGAGADITLTTGAGTQAGWVLVAIHSADWDPWNTMPAAPSGAGWTLLAEAAPPVDDVTTVPRVRMWWRRVDVAGPQSVTFGAIGTPGMEDVHDSHARLLVLSGMGSPTTRAIGELASLPTRADVSGRDVWSPIEAAGILRRLSRSGQPLRSALYRAAMASDNIGMTAYWPCEDPPGSTSVASAVPGVQPLRINVAAAPGAGDAVAVPGSAPGVVIGTGGQLAGSYPWVPDTGVLAYRGVFVIPPAGASNFSRLVDLFVRNASIRRWRLTYLTASSGSVRVEGYNAAGVLTVTGTSLTGLNGRAFLLGANLVESGANINWTLTVQLVGAATPLTATGTFTSHDVGQAGGIVNGAGIDDVTIMHQMVGSDANLGAGMARALTGWAGETAGARLQRLAAEEGIPLAVRGDPADTERMGPQRQSASVLELMTDAAELDGGLLYEARALLALEYRTRADSYNSAPVVELTYGATGEVMPPIEPTIDDDGLVNDLTLSRSDGSSVAASVESGPRSTASPPAGVGPYRGEETINASADSRLPELAAWSLRRSAWPEARWPALRMDLAALGNAGKAALADDVARLDLRDLITVDDVPAWISPNRVRLLAEGYAETLGAYVWTVEARALVPAGPWQLGVLDGSDAGDVVALRVSPASTVTAAAFVAGTDTSLSITGETWGDSSTYPAAYPVDIVVGGVRLTVTAHTAGTLTVVQTPVNGVSGVTIPAGSVVELAGRPAIGL